MRRYRWALAAPGYQRAVTPFVKAGVVVGWPNKRGLCRYMCCYMCCYKWIVTVGTFEARNKSLVRLPRIRLLNGDRL